jgi:hypothetical protein
MYAAGGANQQLRTDPLLQRRHRPGDAGRRQPQAPRGSGKALFLRNGREDLHFLEAIHGVPEVDEKPPRIIGSTRSSTGEANDRRSRIDIFIFSCLDE